MTVSLTRRDLDYLRDQYPLLDIQDIPSQYEKALMYLMRGGYNAIEAARAAGFGQPTMFQRFVDSPEGEAIIQYIRQRDFKEIRVSREVLTDMFFEAYHLAGSAAEKIMATKELGKLHGIYPTSTGGGVQVNIVNNQQNGETGVEMSQKRLQRMSDTELLAMAPHMAHLLEQPQPVRNRPPVTEDPESIVSEQ